MHAENQAANRRFRVTPIGHLRWPGAAVVDLETYYDRFDEATLQILLRWDEALAGLEDYSHLVAIFWFDRARRIRKPRPNVPERREGMPEVGLFATRTPRRPNPLGISVPRLLRREGSNLWVSGIDAWPGTPILDIKGYAPRDHLRMESLWAAHDVERRG